MENLKFKTNIKCGSCIATVTPHLNETVGEGKWQVDLTDPNRILTIEDGKMESKVIESLQKAGYKAERIG